ncbi:uncharacterized protein A1O5_07378 [Cladophialophora psammophila CBS 110553]|uniref:Uncharacterized protein n=1 Tax=Cladophialophora psammophila CBS 110553 TaxID=1182543 RepID=W9WMH1_9EURO|nr:uncharacterized protein A1O5_07378 [Cladophialophora psammophila CBS 110553]EXJ69342.1 hypothetical protein A1O5_07378 [Cladophialophora psammophila CBS 110553]
MDGLIRDQYQERRCYLYEDAHLQLEAMREDVNKINMQVLPERSEQLNSEALPHCPQIRHQISRTTSNGHEERNAPLEFSNAFGEEAEDKVCKLKDELAICQTELSKHRHLNEELQRQLMGHKARLAQMQKLMLRARRKEAVSGDDEIVKRFAMLRSDIFQLVKTHFSKPIPSPKGTYDPDACPEIAELATRANVADGLYSSFFHPTVMLFGIEDHRSDSLFKWVEDSVLARCGNSDELIEWRTSSVRIAKLLDMGDRDQYPAMAADQIWDQIGLTCQHPLNSPLRDHAKTELQDVCDNAYTVALLLRETRIEYEWQQDIRRLNPSETTLRDYEILGTTGPEASDPHAIHRIVFGGVIRGDRHTGRLKDGSTRLCKTGVVIMPPLP